MRAARAADLALGQARELGLVRWERYLAPLPERLRDAPVTELRAAARRVRSAFGPKDSIRDALPVDITEPLLDATDLLLKALDRRDAEGMSGL